jgi:hypothetical protein
MGICICSHCRRIFIICANHLIKREGKPLRNSILGGLIVYASGGLGGEFISWGFFDPLPPVLQQIEIV